MITDTEITFTDCAPGGLPAWVSGFPGPFRDRLSSLPSNAFDELNKMPDHWHGPAQGLANSMANGGFSDEEIRGLLEAAAASYAGSVEERDIGKVLAKCRDKKPRNGRKTPKWKPFDREKVNAILEKSEVKNLPDLQAWFGEPEKLNPWEILESLFPGDPLLCLSARKKERFKTRPLSDWKKDGNQKNFIVPSPMSKREGLTKEGKASGRCLDNTGARGHLVIDFDRADQDHDEQAAIIAHLATLAPLVMVLNTGGKSLHAWFKCDGESEAIHERLMSEAVTLGADKATWGKNQLVRLPGGTHDKTGNPHKVLAFRPEAAKGEIWTRKKSSRYSLTHHSEITFDPVAFDFVEGVLTVGGLSVVYAAPGAGKSFFVLDLAACVASERPWRKREVDGGPVVYFCLEGVKGFMNRILLLRGSGKLPDHVPFHIVSTGLDFFKEGDIAGFIEAITATLGEVKPRLIVIDTLARSMPGGNENAGEDMGKAIDGAGALQAAFGSHVCLVHHSGKDTTRGTRGHSSLKGAVDTEIELTKDEAAKIITAEVTKQKDLEQGQRFPFRLVPSIVGMNERGKEVTSCRVEHLNQSEAPAKPKRGRKPKYSSVRLLELLPVESVGAWQKAAKNEHGMSEATFKREKKKLIEGMDFIRSETGIETAPGEASGLLGS
ncbi:AAA family ATPase [Akkermansiaceae bacterium]|nr:AAA family ATPase [Akkermansiaceae bacterium]